MCAGYSEPQLAENLTESILYYDYYDYSPDDFESTFDNCRILCDNSPEWCVGFSFGVISPYYSYAGMYRRRQLLQSSGTGDCYLMFTWPTDVDTTTQYTGSASCYAKGDTTASDCDKGYAEH